MIVNKSAWVLGVIAASVIAGNSFAAPAKGKAEETKIAFDPKASVVKWEGKKAVVASTHLGEVKLKSGELVMAGDQLKSGQFVIDMTTISNTDLTDAKKNGQLVGHLKSDDFFHVEKYPTSTLKIKKATSVEGIAGPTYEIVADLTIKGKTNEIKFPAVIDRKESKTVAKANITIDRSKWDVRYGSGSFFKGLGDKAIADDIQLDLALTN